MSSKKPREFHLSGDATEFVGGAKFSTDAGQDNTALSNAGQPALPWDDLSRGNPSITFRASPELYAMMTWCKQNVPGGISFLEILRQGAEIKCAELIAKHYKPEE